MTTPPGFTISRESLDPRRGRWVVRAEGVDDVGELVFTRRREGVISADHTGTPESMRGTGAALALVEAMVDHARASGLQVVPLCPYVQAQYRKHPEWADVFTVAPGEKPRLRM